MTDYNVNLTRVILESPYVDTYFTGHNQTQDRANFQIMKLAYSTCMNEDAIKAVGLTPLRKLLQEFEIQYPATAPKTAGNHSTTDELTNVLIWLAKHGVQGLVSSETDVSVLFQRSQ
jgi:endothelin-converting enzyme